MIKKDHTYIHQIALSVIAILVLSVVMYARFRYLDVPFERDEGEYAHPAQMMMKGYVLYGDLYNMKFPGIFLIYAIIMSLFGQTVVGIHLGLLFVNLLTSYFVYKCGQLLMNNQSGLLAALCFLVLSAGPEVQGAFANAEHFVIFFAMWGLWLLLMALRSNLPITFLGAGILLAVSVLMKQHGILFSAFGGVLIITSRLDKGVDLKTILKNSAWYILGLVTPMIIVIIWLLATGVMDKFLWFAFDYASSYASSRSVSQNLDWFLSRVSKTCSSSFLIWSIAMVGLLISVVYKKNRVFYLSFFACSFVALSIGMFFRPHYFVLVLPSIALLYAHAIDVGVRKIGKGMRVLCVCGLLIASVGSYIFLNRDYFLMNSSEQMSFSVYGQSPFLEAKVVGEYIRDHSSPDDLIAIVASEPQIFFYAQRMSASGYSMTSYFLHEHALADQMLVEFASEVEASQPEFLVLPVGHYTWSGSPGRIEKLRDWMNQFRQQYDDEIVFTTDWRALKVVNYEERKDKIPQNEIATLTFVLAEEID